MNGGTTLERASRGSTGPATRRADASQIADDASVAVAGACRPISELIGAGALAGALGATRGDHGGGDIQKELDVLANDMLIARLRNAPVAAMASEELDDAGAARRPARRCSSPSIRWTARRTSTRTSRSARSSRCCPAPRECLPGDCRRVPAAGHAPACRRLRALRPADRVSC